MGGASSGRMRNIKRKKRIPSATDARPKMDGRAEKLGRGAFPIVGVGASAGGLEAFRQLLEALPLDTGMGFVLVQHLDPDHQSQLTQILSRTSSLPVREIINDERVKPNHVYVIPPDTNLTLADGVLKIRPRERTRSPHRPIDTFFESLAQDRGERAIGVVLSGTASDGTIGLEAIKAEGGITFAQDHSAAHDSMPRSAVAAGCVDLVLSPAEIANELARIAKHPYVVGQARFPIPEGNASAEEAPALASTHQDDQRPLPPVGRREGAERQEIRAEAGDVDRAGKSTQDDYKRILLLMRNHSGVDFSLYKSSTILRRINRRVVVGRQPTLEAYAAFLQGNAKELDALYSDLLISVTSFFRNPETFDALKQRVLPELIKQRGENPLRCWVLGCSTGQEAYSIAMAFTEVAERAPRSRRLQIFATDLNDALLDKARQGLYAKSLAEDIIPQRLRRFFVEEDGGYRVSKALREMVIFARQNLISDPPFSRLDLISCRNLLIYLEPSLQRKALPTFHYALKPGGFLLLGASESIAGFIDLFEPIDKKHKIYSKKSGPTPVLHLPARKEHERQTPGPRPAVPVQPGGTEQPESARGELDAQREADRIVINQFAPPGVLVNEELRILQFRGPTDPFLEPPVGKASFDLLKMAREGLMLPLRSAIAQAKKSNQTARKESVRIKRNGKVRRVNLEVIPLKKVRERCFLVLFEEADRRLGALEPAKPPLARQGRSGGREESTRIAELESELSEMRQYLQSMQEQHEAANEQVQSANEEVQSANEELQSINEELETSKEELESANEELTTVNEEMSNRNEELKRLNNDLVNQQTSTKLAIVLFGRDLTIRRFSPQAEKQFDLLVADVGRPIGHIRHGLNEVEQASQQAADPQTGIFAPRETPLDLESLVAEVIAEVREQEREVRDKSGRWHSLRVRPYLTLDGKVDGAVLVLVDIDQLKQIEQASSRLAAIVESSHDAMVSTTLDGVITSWNGGAERLFGYTAAEAIGQYISFIMPPERQSEEDDVLTRLGRGEKVGAFETERQIKGGERISISMAASPIKDVTGQIIGTSRVSRDITESKRAEQRLRESEERLRHYSAKLSEAERRKNEFLAMLGHELRNPLSALTHGLELMSKLPDDTQRWRELRNMMARQTTGMAALLDQLLDISRVISGKVQLSQQRINMTAIVQAAVETVQPLLESQRHRLTIKLPPEEGEKSAFVMGDAARLTQVVENLLTNAAKYTNESGQITVTLEADDSQVRIAVRDSGVGISAELLPHIFEVFTQGPRALDRGQGGLGLGLPLVQSLVEMHGGHVSASSPGLGQGSEFIVTLPRILERRSKERLEREERDRALPDLGKIQPRRILLVDDEADIRDTLAELLEGLGHQTLAVGNGRAALEAVRTFDPEVVLLDLGLPEMDGYEIARRLREEHGDKRIVLIALTGYQSDANRLKEAGFDRHLIKPPSPYKLAALLATPDSGGNGARD